MFAQFDDDGISGIYSGKYNGSLKRLFVYKNGERITGRFISYQGKTDIQVDNEYYFESDMDREELVEFKEDRKILHLKAFEREARAEDMMIVLYPNKKEKFTVTCYGPGGGGWHNLLWSKLKMDRDITSTRFYSFVNSAEDEKILSKSSGKTYPLYKSGPFELRAFYDEPSDLTFNEEINAYISQGFNNTKDKISGGYYLSRNSQIEQFINNQLKSIRREIEKDLPNVRKVHLSHSIGGPEMITIEFLTDGFKTNKAYSTDFARSTNREKINAHNYRKNEEREKREYEEGVKIANEKSRLVEIIHKVNTNSNLPENLKISSEKWLEIYVARVTNDQNLNDTKKFLDVFEQFTGVQTALFKDYSELDIILRQEGQLDPLLDLVNFYNQNTNLIKSNKQLASMIWGYIHALQDNCYLSEGETIELKYTETTTVTEEKSFGLLHAGTTSTDYDKITIVKVPKSFFKAYSAIENNKYKYEPGDSSVGFIRVMEELLIELNCNSDKTKHLRTQLMEVYNNRLKY